MAQATNCQLQMANYVAGLESSTNVRKVTTLWKSMLLANPASRLADVVSNSIMAGAEIAKHPIAAGIDRLAARRTGIRTRMFDTSDLGRASWDAVQKTPRDVRLAMQGIDTFQGNRALDTFQGETQYETPLLNAITKLVFRSTQATDRPFKRLAFERSLREQARLMGAQAGLSGVDLEDYIARTLPRMPDEAVMRAYHDADVATFADNTPMARLLTGAKRAVSEKNPAGELAADVVLPFTRVPSNAAHRVVEYSGAGVAMGYANLRRAFRLATNGDVSEAAKLQQYAVDQMGRGSAGVGALMAGWWLSERGMVSLGYPSTDQGEAGRWEATGKQDYSVRVGNRWYSVKKMAPFGPLLVVGAYAQQANQAKENAQRDAYLAARAQGMGEAEAQEIARQATGDNGENIGGLASGLVGGIFNTMADQPAFTGARQIEELRRDPAGGGAKWAERMAASFIPPVIARWATMIDPVTRETRNGDGLSSVLEGRVPDAIQARVPVASRDLPMRHDVLGESVPKEDSFVRNFLDPFNSRLDRSTQDDVRRELDRLGVAITRMRPNPGEDREEFYRRRETYGVIVRGVLADVIASDEYQSIAEARRWMVRSIPGIESRDVERRIQEEQRAFLEKAIGGVRGYVSSNRRRGSYSGEYGLPTQEEADFATEQAAFRAQQNARERAMEIEMEEPGGTAEDN